VSTPADPTTPGPAKDDGALSVRLSVFYRHPPDPAAFDAYYFSTHVPLARRLPGLKRLDIAKVLKDDPEFPSSYYLVADLWFATDRALRDSMSSPEGVIATGDLKNFASSGWSVVVSTLLAEGGGDGESEIGPEA
jgi:uncharacterized protein (TIGR02118 family)